MTPKKRAQLTQICHDQVIRLKSAEECGKTIAGIATVTLLFEVLEEIVKACPTEPG